MFYILEPVPNWLEAVRLLPPGAAVKAHAVQWISEAVAVNPRIFTVLRYLNDDIQNISADDTDEIRDNRARDWFNRFIDGTFLDGETAGVPHWQATDAISWWNEYYAVSQSPEEQALWWKQERRAARIWQREYRNGPNKGKLKDIRLTICACPVGNDIPWQSAQTATEYDCILDYHGYDKFLAKNERDPLSWRYHCGRWETMDAEFRSRGYYVFWYNGEAGPYLDVKGGWRHKHVLDGDVDAYVEAVRKYLREIKGTNAYQTGRFKGFALFTTGGNWDLYDTNAPEMIKLAKMISEEGWMASEPAPPEPPPIPEPETSPLMTPTSAWGLRVRSTPEVIDGNIVGRIGPGTELRPDDLHLDGDDIWLRWGSMGWSAEWYKGRRYLVEVPIDPLRG